MPSSWTTVVTVLLFLANLFASSNAACPDTLKNEKACKCLSYLDGAVIRCKGTDAPHVIEKLKSEDVTIRELAIEEADIVEIGPRAFRNMRIRSLVMDHNEIQVIHKDAFAGLENTLVSLSLANNRLTEVPTDALAGLSNLLILNLKCNNIGNMYTAVLQNVSRLIELNLACNHICKISGTAFEPIKGTLQSLILDHNCLREVPAEALRNFKNLLALHLQNNDIESIEKLQLMNMVSLLMVRLSYNKIRTIDRYGFNNIPNLRYLFLDHNELNVVEPNVLQQFQHLEIADLSYNNIAEITAGAFQKLERLLQLNLEGNTIRDIAPGAFSQTPLLLLLLGYNCLTGISQQMFQGTPFLRQLSLTHNNIKNIQPFAFIPLSNLQMLDLSNNQLDVVFPATLTPNFAATVILTENPVVCGPSGYHVVKGGKPIMLTSEPNLICDVTSQSQVDKCPRTKPQKPQPLCCSTGSRYATTSTHKPGETVISSLDKLKHSMKVDIPSFTSAPNIKKAMPSMAEVRATTPTAEMATTTATKVYTVKPDPITQQPPPAKQHTPNMQRFWRLTRPPSSYTGLSTTKIPKTYIATSHKRPQSLVSKAMPKNATKATNSKQNSVIQSGSASKDKDATSVRKVMVFNKQNSTAYVKFMGKEMTGQSRQNQFGNSRQGSNFFPQQRPDFQRSMQINDNAILAQGFHPRSRNIQPNIMTPHVQETFSHVQQPWIHSMDATNMMLPNLPTNMQHFSRVQQHHPQEHWTHPNMVQQFPIQNKIFSEQHIESLMPVTTQPLPVMSQHHTAPPLVMNPNAPLHHQRPSLPSQAPNDLHREAQGARNDRIMPTSTNQGIPISRQQVTQLPRMPATQAFPIPSRETSQWRIQPPIPEQPPRQQTVTPQPPGVISPFMDMDEPDVFGSSMQSPGDQILFDEPFMGIHFSPIENVTDELPKKPAESPAFVQKVR